MYKPELKVDNKELGELPKGQWSIQIAPLGLVGIYETEMMAFKMARGLGCMDRCEGSYEKMEYKTFELGK